MNGKDIFNAVGNIDDKYISEFADTSKFKKKKIFLLSPKFYGSIAAVFVLGIAVFIALQKKPNRPKALLKYPPKAVYMMSAKTVNTAQIISSLTAHLLNRSLMKKDMTLTILIFLPKNLMHMKKPPPPQMKILLMFFFRSRYTLLKFPKNCQKTVLSKSKVTLIP